MVHDERVKPRRKRAYPLKVFLLPFILPLMLIVFGSVMLSVTMRYDVRDYAAHLKQKTLSSLLTTQRTFSDLQNLGGAFHELIYTTDAMHARLSYVKAWSILSDTTLEQIESIKPVISRLFDHLRDIWSFRERYDADRAQANVLWDQLYTNWFGLLSAAAGGDRGAVDIYGQTSRVTMRHLEPVSVHLKNLLALEESYAKFCARDPESVTSDVQAFVKQCNALTSISGELKTKIIEIENTRNLYLKHVHRLEADSDLLNREFSILETKDLLQRINQINHIYESMLPAFLAFVLVAALLAFGVILGVYLLARPLSHLIKQMHHFLSTNELPTVKANSWVTEINDVILWLTRFCVMIKQNRQDYDELTVQYDELLNDTFKDSLTGLANRKALVEFVNRHPVLPAGSTILMIDLDYFKRINDTRGHLFGDKILRAFARQLRANLARGDVVYRYGGEEFCIYLTNVTQETAFSIARRLSRCVRRISVADASVVESGEAEQPLTVSIGIAAVTQTSGEKDFLTLLHDADEAMYEAKRTGRNRICVHQAKSESTLPENPI